MRATVATADVPNHHKRLESVAPVMAKADLKKVEAADQDSWKRQVGQAIDYAIAMSNRTQKEVWVALGHETGAQLNRWIAATENAQLGPLFAIDWLRQPLVIALAGLAGDGVEVTTQITLRKLA